MTGKKGQGMNKELFLQKLREAPVIAAVKKAEQVDAALDADCNVIFLLCGNIFNLGEIVQKAKEKGKLIFLHVDLIDGFSRDALALRYIAQTIAPDGIISTKNNLLKAAKELGLLTVQRLFIIDSLSIQTTVKASALINPDMVEILPGIMPRITKQLAQKLDVPIIVGGLISEPDDIKKALEAGAHGVSTSAPALWRKRA